MKAQRMESGYGVDGWPECMGRASRERYIGSGIACLLLMLAGWIPAVWAQANSQAELLAPPAWVVEQPLPEAAALPIEDIDGGTYYRLVDQQVRVQDTGPVYYDRYAIQLLNNTAVQQASQISITYDPSYESLHFHRLQVWRDGQRIDKWASATVKDLQRETELETLIYDGRLTRHVILADIRPGDVLEYAYSIEGGNPIFAGHFSYSLPVQWSIPVQQQNFRLLSPRPLLVQAEQTPLSPSEGKQGGWREYQLQQSAVAARRLDPNVPDWYNPWGRIYFSEFDRWSQVVDWALPLYQTAYDQHAELAQQAQALRLQYAEPEQQIMAALLQNQTEIRYLGLEMGVNSHLPRQPQETLQQRYGDCKDKSVLLVALLQQLGVEAYPALVHTEIGPRLAQMMVSPKVFNHVLVQVHWRGRVYWLDPTRQYQGGTLDQVFQPDYGYALVVRPGTQGLVSMASPPAGVTQSVQQQLDFSQGVEQPGKMEVTSVYRQLQAERMRARLASDSHTAIQQSYVDYYQDYYDSLAAIAPMASLDDPQGNQLTVTEYYQLPIWPQDDSQRFYQLSLYGDLANNNLNRPDRRQRQDPYALHHPIHFSHQIEVLLPEAWQIDETPFVENNAHFTFSFSAEALSDPHRVVMRYEYQSLQDHVPAADFGDYLAALDRSREYIEYQLTKNTQFGAADDFLLDVETELVVVVLLVAFELLVLIYVLAEKYFQGGTAAGQKGFYPVSLIKIIVMSVATFNIYLVYWWYRNWLWIKQQDQKPMMPFARAFFSVFWFYPFYQRLRQDSEQRYQKNMLIPTAFAVAAAVWYLLGQVLVELPWVGYLLGLSALVPVLLLAGYINHIHGESSDEYRQNSRWCLRHYLLAALLPTNLLVPLV